MKGLKLLNLPFELFTLLNEFCTFEFCFSLWLFRLTFSLFPYFLAAMGKMYKKKQDEKHEP
ncbi:unnamed protein product [Trifolium pratense]|uniref:Uncharacterized protein n=1 Tax=Trifolium pratense TaxID=57577 RepID=A0ACB0LQH6_TRIPR|nr:unnamed protein product [Trifolium pratense]